jgi:membrane protein DedA with SNARE-associated domain
MNATDFVHAYGYYAVVVGTFFEGELVMLAAGVAAYAGVLSLPAVILAGMLGIFASDTFCFLLGRVAGSRLKRWFPRLHARLAGALRLIENQGNVLIVFYQFFPGLCTVTPMAFGMTAIPLVRFLALDLMGNVFWTLAFSFGGYAFGTVFERLVHDSYRWELGLIGLLAGAGLAVWKISRIFGAKAAQPA